MDISVVIPLFNEEESLKELCEWIVRIMNEKRFSYEIILIDDGSRDRSWEILERLGQENDNIKSIRFRRNYGKSAALNEGFKAAKGNVIITMTPTFRTVLMKFLNFIHLLNPAVMI